MEKQTVLEVENLSKEFQPRRKFFNFFGPQVSFLAVNNVSFKLNKGEILGVLGPNGAGKTTIIQMLLSTLTPTSGKIHYFGKDFIRNRSSILENVAFASTYLRLPGRLTILENLHVYGRLFGLSFPQIDERAEKFLKFFSMWNHRTKEISQLSAGQITRVMIVKAFLAYPKIVLLDEPTAALDPDIAQDVRKFLLNQREEYGVSILLTSHNMDEVSQVCDRVLVLKDGKIIASDTPESLAESVSIARVHLMVTSDEQGDALVKLADENNLPLKKDNHFFEISVNEQKISELLIRIAQAGIVYSEIYIDRPTLEDYFLQLVQKT